MSFLLPKTPKVAASPAIPQRNDEEVQSAADEQKRLLAAKTKATSWLTGGLGAPRTTSLYAGSKLLSGA